MPINLIAEIYSDGSCHTQLCIGAWASVLLINNQKITLEGLEMDTTHNRMELLAVIKSLDYIRTRFQTITQIHVVSDSQYVVGLLGRRQKFLLQDFKTKAGRFIPHVDLVKQLFSFLDQYNIQFTKIKAHLKQGEQVNYNIEVDKRCRNIVRQAVNQVKK
jgi:ribonuclease HI